MKNKMITSKVKRSKKLLLKDGLQNNLEEKVREQTDQIKQGEDREKQGADREKLGAVREKQGEAREKLAEEQIRIRTKAMESTFDGIFIIDAKRSNYPIIYANPSFYTLTGYPKSEVIGKNYFLLYGLDD